MELENFTARKNLNESDLAEVALRIRPLPEDVTPSVEFLTRTRLRLLKLEPSDAAGREKTRDRKAA